ncbi:MAG: hypothetical protein UX80_C0024G0016 [Candidatus Amesbacteria bacterium GW2011_GWA2_47_11b]|uniref:Uncharacterized protein n=3 Tax=Candidatus Amesiibacteriota TaxID=1752730 RepID=A0A0G1SJV5_9BACT|nr:MAG: hypothetical protein UX42_C0008G0027 [Microgenomates group bacterium GW2011_GWC1_46_20]KKU57150.1 MAG: hypothetical protein UX80_C0024G0016 [Candidatus Amesbacteria bacterium GW2011_GWA2_47_11b]KKU69707.1 MAG: hypothetical protein UX92_C0012G0050 [Candidatus Amesbacteria bacterium GW2011_GWA1_47_20]KKU82925.1 MAG: hypothetical protein UY11_C0035G0016 [Candidatus Amesbacteria bacterium GW2011_GWC2_47_8]
MGKHHSGHAFLSDSGIWIFFAKRIYDIGQIGRIGRIGRIMMHCSTVPPKRWNNRSW